MSETTEVVAEQTIAELYDGLSDMQKQLIPIWSETVKNGGTVEDVANKLIRHGFSTKGSTVSTVASQVRGIGIPLPKMKKRSSSGGNRLVKGSLSDAEGKAMFAAILSGELSVSTPLKEYVESRDED